jgi:transcriptional regulator with XRE-family HTH domain
MQNNLQTIRWEKSWSQAQLARTSGVTQQMISTIENKKSANPTVRTVLRLSNALNTPVEEMFML